MFFAIEFIYVNTNKKSEGAIERRIKQVERKATKEK